MAQRYWKGPWLPSAKAAEWVGRSRRGFTRLVRRCPTLHNARRRQGEGAGRPTYVYPVQALDHAMNTEAE